MPPGTPDEVQPPAEPLRHVSGQSFRLEPTGRNVPEIQYKIRWKKLIPGALILLVLAGVGSLSFAPLILIFVVAAGGLSVAIYHRLDASFELRPRGGFKVGVYTALLVLIVTSVLNFLLYFTATGRELMNSALSTYHYDPQVSAAIREVLKKAGTPAGAAQLLLQIVANGALLAICSGIGGAIGAALFGRRNH